MRQDIHYILKEHFGFDAFRNGQEEIIRAICDGTDVLAVMPTGGGKSLCFQIPALVSEGITLVISPLIALMRNQVHALTANGIEAGALTSLNSDEENERVFSAIDDRRLKLLYLSPERLANPMLLSMLKKLPIDRIIVDEAHCIAEWGHDFRPDYLRVGELRHSLDVPVAAFTATANEETKAEISKRLFKATKPKEFIFGHDRPNLHLAFEAKYKPREQLLNFVRARKGQTGIIYCSSRKKTEVLAKALRDEGFPAIAYHAGLEPELRRKIEHRFEYAETAIICATIAFGMGIDKPDIRFVVHADLPQSIESYYQGIGRAGRDGMPADTLTLYGADDIRLHQLRIEEKPIQEEARKAEQERLFALLYLADSVECRRKTLLAYFGEAAKPCGRCDICENAPRLFDARLEVKEALSMIISLGERYGQTKTVEALLKAKFPVDGRAAKSEDWKTILRQMLSHGLLTADAKSYGVLELTQAGREFLKRKSPFYLRKLEQHQPKPVVKKLLQDEDEALFLMLRQKRAELARALGVPPYFILHDKSLIEMVQNAPQTLDEMAKISGMGATKLKKYGTAFLTALTGDAVAVQHPSRQKLNGHETGALFDALKEVQIALARGETGTDTYLNCTHSTLAKIVSQKPRNKSELERIQGMGPKKADRFGDAFLEVILKAG